MDLENIKWKRGGKFHLFLVEIVVFCNMFYYVSNKPSCKNFDEANDDDYCNNNSYYNSNHNLESFHLISPFSKKPFLLYYFYRFMSISNILFYLFSNNTFSSPKISLNIFNISSVKYICPEGLNSSPTFTCIFMLFLSPLKYLIAPLNLSFSSSVLFVISNVKIFCLVSFKSFISFAIIVASSSSLILNLPVYYYNISFY